jgi:hypothetical protein
MKLNLLLVVPFSVGLLGACRPEVGPPISLVKWPSILAIKGEPAEAAPKTPVVYEVLAVDTSGPIPAPGTEIDSSVLWSMCDQPKPPAESNSVSPNCLDANALPGVSGPTATSYSAAMPDGACTLFGPLTPPVPAGSPAIRPRDPDVTGGYYQPVRASLAIPEDRRRSGMATEDTIVAFGLERIYCGLANAPGSIGPVYAKTYHLNTNPQIAALTIQDASGSAIEVPRVADGGAPFVVSSSQAVAFSLSWTPDSVESYPVFDVLSRTLVSHRETMRASWYATGGTFDHDVTGRSETETETFSSNSWRPTAVGVIHLWVVLHDSRGGTDFAAYDVQVEP